MIAVIVVKVSPSPNKVLIISMYAMRGSSGSLNGE